MKTLKICIPLLILLAIPQRAFMQAIVTIDASKTKHTFSEYLNGSHFVYGAENDSLYKNEKIADWMRRSNVKMIRWPGGTSVMRYHWDALTGDNFGPDRWDTVNYVEMNIPPMEYMDLDEYISYSRRINAEPLVGVNIKSGKQFKTDADGLDEARRLIQYCKDKNYNVKYWYIGNEGYAKGFPATLYAKYIDMYAEVLKEVDPTITIIGDWKFGPEAKNRFEESMQIIQQSKHLDIMEYHEKWGNECGLGSGKTVTKWKSELPLYDGKFDYYCDEFYKRVEKMGKHTKLAFNEWGVGGNLGGTAHDYGLLVADYMLMMMRHDVFSACYWNLNMGQGSQDNRVLTTKSNGMELEKFNPVAHVFEMTADALGGKYLEMKSTDKKVYGIASLSEDKKRMSIYILNKSDQINTIKFKIEGFKSNVKVCKEWFDEQGNGSKEDVTFEKGSMALPAYSFTHLSLEKD